LIQIHLFPSNFHYFSSNNNKTIKKIKKKIIKNLLKNNHNNDDGDYVNTSTSTTACISNYDNSSNNHDYNYCMINDDNVNPSFHNISSNSKNCNNNRKQRRIEKSIDKSNEIVTKNPSISDNTMESITISSSSSSSLAFSSSSFISSSSPSLSSTKSTTNEFSVSNSPIKTNNNLIKFVDVDNYVEDDAHNSHEIDDAADDDDEMNVVTEALKKSCITVPSKIRFGRKGR